MIPHEAWEELAGFQGEAEATLRALKAVPDGWAFRREDGLWHLIDPHGEDVWDDHELLICLQGALGIEDDEC